LQATPFLGNKQRAIPYPKAVSLSEKVHFLPQCQSTNDEAWASFDAGRMRHSHLLYTHTQLAGRGQRGTLWHSAPGKNLLCSTLLYVQNSVSVATLFDLSRAVALAIAQAIEAWTKGLVAPQLKWPNDIFFRGQKLGGILIENRWKEAMPEWAVVGLGLNVNQEIFDDTLNATSLRLSTGQPFSVDEGAHILQQNLEACLAMLEDVETLRAAYENKLIGIGQEALFVEPNEDRFRGYLLGTTPEGFLRILTPTGERHFDLKEIRQDFDTLLD
jgi:BirA family transcriptional regulator, biotin operon repressor / biotin---[acetyl-CoA-carboxylase] ligase